MIDEVLLGLDIHESGFYLDCTFGRGGHSERILDRLGGNGGLLALDRDGDALKSDKAKKLQSDPRFEIEQKNFACLKECVDVRGLSGQVSGVLMDLGVSSPQLDDPSRGFSFLSDGPLDMRMDQSSSPSAAEWLSKATEKELISVLKGLGEERYAKRIAMAIIHYRAQQPLTRTRQLVEIIEHAAPTREKNKHPATRSFQAIRIFINRELDELQKGLRQALKVLCPAGRLVVIAFHSLEDRIVKRFIRDQSRGGEYPPDLPVNTSAFKPLLKAIGKAHKPGSEEISRNPRARSAILRIAEKLA